MARTLDEQSLLTAYEGRTDLQGAIRNAAAAGPQYVELFNYISAYIITLLSAQSSCQQISKKQKLNNGRAAETRETSDKDAKSTSQDSDAEEVILLAVKDISFIIPQRKKLTLCFTDQYLFAQSSVEKTSSTKLAWKDIEYVFLLPIPEKSQAQFGFLFLPYNSHHCLTKRSSLEKNAPPHPEPIVFTVPPKTAPNPTVISGSLSKSISDFSDDFLTLFNSALNARFKAVGINKEIISPDEKIFSSAQLQSHRPNEKAVWIKAFRGSKDGYLFFLPSGILWAFKKPLLFFPHSRISGVSATSILLRTFNLNLEFFTDTKEEEHEEIEFTMLDIDDFGNIMKYINRHNLQDRSMAERRKAKFYNVNKSKKTDEDSSKIEDPNDGDHKKLGEDEEDEEVDEDYDPGHEGESDGSGINSSDEESYNNNRADTEEETYDANDQSE
ncbi:hypothetical protein Golomagni_02256 [Golovinomyces magnicellulatus]|nr:hypothetical protein Golomagni_02256 [Golovinomyces magnicellulatus]